jgi:hypothetical protein
MYKCDYCIATAVGQGVDRGGGEEVVLTLATGIF